MSIAFHLDIDVNHLKSWIGHASAAIMVVNQEGIVVAANRPFQRLIQCSFEEIQNQSFIRFLKLPVSFQLLRKQLGWVQGQLQVKQQNQINTNIHIERKRHLDKSYYILTLYPEFPNQMELHQLMINMPIGLMILKRKQNLVHEINHAACAALDVTRDEVLYRSIDQILVKQEHEKLLSFLYDPMQFGQRMEVQWGQKHLLFTTDHPVDETDPDDGYHFFIENVTQTRSLEQQLKYNNRLATIGQIAAGSAHEIRNPLTSIKGFLQVISSKMEALGHQKEQSYINIMLKEINRINHLVGELLLLSKPKEMDKTSVQISQVMKEILPIIKNEALLHNVRIHIDYQTSSQVEVLADGKLLKQVFLNLCKNAIEAMKTDGCLTIRLLRKKQKKLLVEFRDTGSGIPLAVRKKIFKPFFTTKDNGTGLGLPICKQIMKEIGGKISVDSSKNGTVFRVLLPLV